MRKILFFLFLFFYLNSFAQQNLVNSQWKWKIDQALEIVKNNEPSLFEAIVKDSYIQLGEMNEDWGAYSKIEYVAGQKIQWILFNYKKINWLSRKRIASMIVHEALHLKIINETDPVYYSMKSEGEELKDHSYIYNYQLNFLIRVGASSEDIRNHKRDMISLGMKIKK
jgi:hypothetical protein